MNGKRRSGWMNCKSIAVGNGTAFEFSDSTTSREEQKWTTEGGLELEGLTMMAVSCENMTG
jgi:hypothetical protein